MLHKMRATGVVLAAVALSSTASAKQSGPETEIFGVICKHSELIIKNSDPYWHEVKFDCTPNGKLRIVTSPHYFLQ